MGLTCTDTLSTAYLKANMHQKGFFFGGGGRDGVWGFLWVVHFGEGGFQTIPIGSCLPSSVRKHDRSCHYIQ